MIVYNFWVIRERVWVSDEEVCLITEEVWVSDEEVCLITEEVWVNRLKMFFGD